MPIPISDETRNRVTLASARPPGPSYDPNVGKHATFLYGHYKGLEGVLYPKNEGISYIGNYGDYIEGQVHVPNKKYLLLFFFEDGSLFCGVDADLEDLDTGAIGVPDGDGTNASPYKCGIPVSKYDRVVNYFFTLPDFAGTVNIGYQFHDPNGGYFDVYFSDDLATKIATTNGDTTGSGELSFFYDPAFNSRKIKIEGYVYQHENTIGLFQNSSWTILVDCPE